MLSIRPDTTTAAPIWQVAVRSLSHHASHCAFPYIVHTLAAEVHQPLDLGRPGQERAQRLARRRQLRNSLLAIDARHPRLLSCRTNLPLFSPLRCANLAGAFPVGLGRGGAGVELVDDNGGV